MAEEASGSGAHADDAMRLECTRYEHMAGLAVLASASAHQVSSPLNTLLLNAQLALSRAARDDTGVREPLEKLLAAVEQCATASRQLAAFAGEPPHAPAPHDAARLAEEACALAAPAFGDAGARARIELDALPELSVDAVAIRTALWVLLRDAATADGVTTVHLRGAMDDGALRLVVHDDGPPPPARMLHGAFNPLHEDEPAAARRVLGAGVAHHAVNRHGGALAVSGESRGTRVELTLPA